MSSWPKAVRLVCSTSDTATPFPRGVGIWTLRPGLDTGSTNDSPHSGRPGVAAFLRFRARLSSASYEATKHALVLIAPVFVLHSTNVDGPGHQAKNVCREKAQPLLLLGCEGCGKRLPCVGKLFELS